MPKDLHNLNVASKNLNLIVSESNILLYILEVEFNNAEFLF